MGHENRPDIAGSELVSPFDFQQRSIFHRLMGSRKRADGLHLDNRSRSVGEIELHVYPVAAQELVFKSVFAFLGESYTFRMLRDEFLEVPVLVTFPAALALAATTGRETGFRVRFGIEFLSEGSNDDIPLTSRIPSSFT